MRTHLPLPQETLKQVQNRLKTRGRERFSAPFKKLMTEPTVNSLVDLHEQFLGFVRRRVNDGALAEDILQSAYVRSMEFASQLREAESSVAWFYRILRNAVIDHYRRRATESVALERWAKELETSSALDPLLYEAACQCIAGALKRLTPAYASLLREVDLGEMAVGDYAEAHGIAPSTAHVRAHRARKSMRKELIRCCGTCATHGLPPIATCAAQRRG